MTVLRLEHIGIVVDDLAAATAFFTALGLKLESEASVEGDPVTAGHNRNFDLRREFAVRADSAPIRVTSVLNGAFLDMLAGEMPIIQPRLHRVIHWGDPDQPLDFTTKDDTAAYTAAVALDDTAPRLLPVAGATVSPREIAYAVSEISGQNYRTLRVGSVASLARLARLAHRVAPQHGQVFPAWQAIQYMRDMFSGDAQLRPLDNDRYPELEWTSLADRLSDSPFAAGNGAPHSAGQGPGTHPPISGTGALVSATGTRRRRWDPGTSR